MRFALAGERTDPVDELTAILVRESVLFLSDPDSCRLAARSAPRHCHPHHDYDHDDNHHDRHRDRIPAALDALYTD